MSSASRKNALCLVLHVADALATLGNVHALEPVAQAVPELHLAAVCFQRAAGQIEHDEPRLRAVGDSDGDRNPIADRAAAWLDQQHHALGLDLPHRVVGQLFVGEGCLGKAGVDESDSALLVGHIVAGDLDDPAVEVELQHCLPAVCLDELVNRPHGRLHGGNMDRNWSRCRRELYRE
jgi:hypothetical protein